MQRQFSFMLKELCQYLFMLKEFCYCFQIRGILQSAQIVFPLPDIKPHRK